MSNDKNQNQDQKKESEVSDKENASDEVKPNEKPDEFFKEWENDLKNSKESGIDETETETKKEAKEKKRVTFTSWLLGAIFIFIVGAVIYILFTGATKNELAQTNNKIGVLQTANNTTNNRLGEFIDKSEEKTSQLRADIDDNTSAVNTLNENQVKLDQKVGDLTGRVVKLEKIKPITLASPQSISKTDKTKASTTVRYKTNIVKPQKSKTVVKNKNLVKSSHHATSSDGEALRIAKEAKAIAEAANTKASNAESIAKEANGKAELATTVALNADKKANIAISGTNTLKVDVRKLVKDECLRRQMFDNSTICE